MKKLMVLFLLLATLQAKAFNVGTTLSIRCGPLTEPKEKVQQAFEVVSLKLEECLENKLNCSQFTWPQNLKTKDGEPLNSKNNLVDLWELQRNFQYALECAAMLEENPGKEAGIFEF